MRRACRKKKKVGATRRGSRNERMAGESSPAVFPSCERPWLTDLLNVCTLTVDIVFKAGQALKMHSVDGS